MEVWIGRDGERHGPYKEGDIRQWLHSGQVSGSDLAWYEGLADWQPLSVLFPDAAAQVGDGATIPASPLPQTTTVALEDYAGFWKRVAAYILDFIVLIIPNTIIQNMLGNQAAEATMRASILSAPGDLQALMNAYNQYFVTMWPAVALVTAFTWLYFAFCESSAWQATVGKLALGIRVTDMQGARISLLRAIGRYPAKYLSAIIFFIGFLMVAWTQRKQGLHDLIAGTLVLNGRASDFNTASTAPDSKSSFSA